MASRPFCRSLLAGLATLLVILTACGGGEPVSAPPAPTVATVSVAPTSLSLLVGATGQLQTTVTMSDGSTSTSAAVSWTSNSQTVATVSGGGLSATVTAVSPGTATITAASGSASASATVTVTAPASIALAASAAAVPQGGTGSSTITVTRTNFSGALTLSLDAPPAGITGTFAPLQGATTGQQTSLLTLTVVASVAPGTYPLIVRATGAGIPPVTTALSVTVSAASFAISLGSRTLTVAQGGPSGNTILRVARSGLNQPIQLGASGAPAGLTVAFNPASVVADSAILSVVAVAAVPGTYDITVRASAPPFPDQTTTLSVTVQAPAFNTTVDLRACQYQGGWFAVQDGPTSPWIVVQGQAGVYRFNATAATVGIAYSSTLDLRYRWTSVVYETRARLSSLDPYLLCELPERANPEPTFKTLAVQAPSLLGGAVTTSIGGVFSGPFGGTAAVSGPPTGVHDLVAVSVAPAVDTMRVLIRRGIDTGLLPEGALVGPPLSFTGSGTSPLESAVFSLVGSPGGRIGVEPYMLMGAQCSLVPMPRDNGVTPFLRVLAAQLASPAYGSVFAAPHRLSPPSRPYTGSYHQAQGSNLVSTTAVTGIPTTLLRGGELRATHIVRQDRFTAFDLTGEEQSLWEVYAGATRGSYVLPSAMPAITPGILPGNGYRRLRFSYSLPSDLADAAFVRYAGSSDLNILSMRVSRGVLGSAAVDLTTPDFAGLPGWLDSWGPHGTANYEIRGESDTRPTYCAPGRMAISSRYGIS
ncbi:MAG: Ig-like domain-containing protein [Gemmatimonadetes bacterium]|nr:Ig-like domain-containing protein [Gemmatimonadota bacterium]